MLAVDDILEQYAIAGAIDLLDHGPIKIHRRTHEHRAAIGRGFAIQTFDGWIKLTDRGHAYALAYERNVDR